MILADLVENFCNTIFENPEYAHMAQNVKYEILVVIFKFIYIFLLFFSLFDR